MNATVLRTLQDVERLATQWPVPASTVFVSASFVLAWLSQHQADSEPFVIALHEDQDRLVAVAPWCLVRHGRRKELTGVGGSEAGYHDPLIGEATLASQVASLLVACLKEHRRSWDFLTLTLEPEASGRLMVELKRLGMLFPIEPSWRHHQHADLTCGWEAYRQSHASIFKNAERRARKLAGRAHRYLQADAQNLHGLLDELFRLHHLHLGDKREWVPYYDLIRDVCVRGIERGEICLYAMEIEGRVAAVDLALRSGPTVYGVLRGYDREFASLGVGTLLTVWEFEQYYQAGARRIDFGGGYYEWKESYQTGVLEVCQVQLSPSWRGMAHLAWTPILKTWIKRHPTLLALTKPRKQQGASGTPAIPQARLQGA